MSRLTLPWPLWACSWWRLCEHELCSELSLLIPLVTEIPPQNVSGTAALNICLNCYKFCQRHEIQGDSTHFLMCVALLKLQSLLEIRQQGRNPCTASVGTNIRLEAPVETKIFCYSIPSTPFLLGNRAVESSREEKREGKRGMCTSKVCDTHTENEGQKSWLSSAFPPDRGSVSSSPLCLFHFRGRHSHFHSLSQLKGRFAYFPLSIPRRNAALPRAFAVFPQQTERPMQH